MKQDQGYEQLNLKQYTTSIQDFDELPGLIDNATKLMDIGDGATGTRRAFAKDVLSIEISGPDRPQLTLVDLPGLIHSENKAQTQEDVKMVSELIEQYISNPRTVIFPIISAKNDYANQIILKRARDVDPKGNLTLGIITKPDDLPEALRMKRHSSVLQKTRIFSSHWGGMSSRIAASKSVTIPSLSETNPNLAFFAKGKWLELPKELLGIEPLRARLSDLLFDHIKRELPKLREDLDQKYDETMKNLQSLGEKRSTLHEQKQYLMKLSMLFYDITKAGVNGHHEDDYFGGVDTNSKIGALSARRLRAMIQHLNIQFAARMRKYGHKYRIKGDVSADDEEEDIGSQLLDAGLEEQYAASAPPQNVVTKTKALSWIKKSLSAHGGASYPAISILY